MDFDWLRNNTDYIEILKDIINYEKENKESGNLVEREGVTDSYWEYSDVSKHPSRLHQLSIHGFLNKIMDTNSTTLYCLSDRQTIEETIEEMNITEDGVQVSLHEFPSEEDDLDGVFDDVVGFDDVKWLLKRAITTEDITNILFVGPSGSAKTVFLRCINKNFEDSIFMSGSPTSGPGVIDKMFEVEPKYMLIDEMDDMESSTQEVLSQYTETGIVDETKIGKDRKMKTNTKTFGSCNNLSDIESHIEDRFLILEFEKYTKEQYKKVCVNILPKEQEDVTEDDAKIIADKVWDMEGEGNVRTAIQVSRLSRGDPEKVLSVVENYSGDSLDSII